MKSLLKALCPLPVLLLPITGAGQEQEVTIQTDTLSAQVYMLTGQGGNIGIYVGSDHVFMVDDQFNRLSEKIRAAIARLSDKPIAFLFNTHMHGDHTGGNASFNGKNTTLVAHDNVRGRVLEREKANLEAGKIDESYLKRMLPEVTFSDHITFYDEDETILGFHVHEAHTDGDALIYFTRNNVLHMGDTYFAGRYPYIDLGSGGSVDGLIGTQKRAMMLINDQTVIIPGHGRPSNKGELAGYIAMLEDLKARILDAIESGASLEEVLADPDIGEPYDATYGSGFISPERIRETFYRSLSKS